MQLSDIDKRELMPEAAARSDLLRIQEEVTPLQSTCNSPRVQPGRAAIATIPVFTADQMTAAQAEQQKSMIEYSMQVRVLQQTCCSPRSEHLCFHGHLELMLAAPTS